MTVAVLADADDAHSRLRGPKKRCAGGSPRAVVPHLQDVCLGQLAGEGRFGHEARIAHQQCRESAIGHCQHDRVLVEIVALARPHQRRMEHPEADAIDGPFGPGSRRVPANAACGKGGEPAVVRAVTELFPGLDHSTEGDLLDHCPGPPDVVAVGVRQDEAVQAGYPLAGQQWQQHTSPRVEPASIHWPGVDGKPVAARSPDQRGVALTDIHEK